MIDDENGWELWSLRSANLLDWNTKEEVLKHARMVIRREDIDKYVICEFLGGEIVNKYAGDDLEKLLWDTVSLRMNLE